MLIQFKYCLNFNTQGVTYKIFFIFLYSYIGKQDKETLIPHGTRHCLAQMNHCTRSVSCIPPDSLSAQNNEDNLMREGNQKRGVQKKLTTLIHKIKGWCLVLQPIFLPDWPTRRHSYTNSATNIRPDRACPSLLFFVFIFVYKKGDKEK